MNCVNNLSYCQFVYVSRNYCHSNEAHTSNRVKLIVRERMSIGKRKYYIIDLFISGVCTRNFEPNEKKKHSSKSKKECRSIEMEC